jgi:hypothetical protein
MNWNQFRTKYKGKGYTLKQLSSMYKKASKKSSKKASKKSSKKNSQKKISRKELELQHAMKHGPDPQRLAKMTIAQIKKELKEPPFYDD